MDTLHFSEPYLQVKDSTITKLTPYLIKLDVVKGKLDFKYEHMWMDFVIFECHNRFRAFNQSQYIRICFDF